MLPIRLFKRADETSRKQFDHQLIKKPITAVFQINFKGKDAGFVA